jgi:hypothetical protein
MNIKTYIQLNVQSLTEKTMNTHNRTNNIFLAIAAVLAAGVLTGCQYCEPLLMATLVIGAVVFITADKGLAYSPFAESRSAGRKHLSQKL